MSRASSGPEPRVLLSGLAFVESARWHEGRLWFAHWGTGEIVAVDLDGNAEVTGHGPDHLGWSIDWLPDGRLLVTGQELMRQEPDGSMARHADLTGVASHGWNEIVVDGRGNIYLNGIGFDFLGGKSPTPGIIALVTPDGSARAVAGDLAFPNGMVVTPDNSTLVISESFAGRLTAFDIAADGSLSNRRAWAEGLGPDGICMDADGAIWAQTADTFAHTHREGAPQGAVVRVREGGEVLGRVETDRACFACALGGPDGRTLFLLAADWRGTEHVDEAVAARTGQVLMAQAPAPGAGWP
jgi:sugar lactone lactonase YvrE